MIARARMRCAPASLSRLKMRSGRFALQVVGKSATLITVAKSFLH